MLANTKFEGSNRFALQNTLILFNRITEILAECKNYRGKKLNFSKLMDYLNVPKTESDGIVLLILKFQHLFRDLQFQVKKIDGKYYFLPNESIETAKDKIKIMFRKEQVAILCDAVYVFQQLNKGKGFNLHAKRDKFSRDIEALREDHPYFFETRGNGFIFVSEMGIEVGNLCLSHLKNKKEVANFTYKNYQFKVI